jgi:hypothetical protein
VPPISGPCSNTISAQWAPSAEILMTRERHDQTELLHSVMRGPLMNRRQKRPRAFNSALKWLGPSDPTSWLRILGLEIGGMTTPYNLAAEYDAAREFH